MSPLVAFSGADQAFQQLWLEREAAVKAEADAARAERELLRAGMSPNLVLALIVLGAFLVVMFLFLVVAIERHLRKAALEARTVAPAPQAITGTRVGQGISWDG